MYLETHPEEWAVLESCCWISISRFYRDNSLFLFLEQQVMPHLARQIDAEGGGNLRCWSLGCAAGEEPYSLSLLWRLKLQKSFPSVQIMILSTDIDDQAIARAVEGCYGPSNLKDLPEDWRMQGFVQTGEGFSLRPEYREPVDFLIQDIRETTPEETFHIILCRYLAFTYFDTELQSKTLRQLVERLHPGGVLVIGQGETLPEETFDLIAWSEKEGVYRRAEPALSRHERANLAKPVSR